MKSKNRLKQTEIGDGSAALTTRIPEGWQESAIGDHIELVYGDGLPARERKSGTIHVFGSNGVVGFHNEPLVKGPGIIIGRKGTVGQVTFSKTDFWPIDTTYYVKVKGNDDIVFWYYFLSTLGLNQMNSHSAVPGLNRDNVYAISALLPSLSEQRAIAKILSDLDDKIELNHQMNKTLESICQAIFKRWFVDFEFPNEQDKPYQSSGGKMVDSESGKIPEGWRAEAIGDVVRVVGGSTPSTKNLNYWNGDIHWATPKDLSSLTSEALLDTERRITDAGLQEVGSGLLPVGTVLLSSRAPIGYIAVAEIPVAINQGFIGIICTNEMPMLFIKEWVKHNMGIIKGRANGTTFQEISKSNFRPIPIIVPPREILDQYVLIAGDAYRQVVNSLKQTNLLIDIRDSLLPRLLSGRIIVS